MHRILKFLILVLVTGCLFSPVLASEDYTYQVYIEDEADLLSASQEDLLKNELEKLNIWGNAAFISCSENNGSATSYSENWSYEHFHNESSVVFFIDMANREIIMSTTGDIEKVVTKNYINSICDNVYPYASDGDYYTCASQAFSQVLTLMQNEKIAQPMKHINNGLLALLSAILINFLIVYFSSSKMAASDKKLLENVIKQLDINHVEVNYSHTAKTYSPLSSSDSSSSSSRSSDGSGGSGFSGSSGGHKF